MLNKKIRIATRTSLLALQQTNLVVKKLKTLHPNLKIDLIPIITKGDKVKKKKKNGKGIFIKELELALLENKADIAIHSVKDIPIDFSKELSINNICKRGNSLDAFVSNNYNCINNLPKNAKIGTSSLRRKFQLIMYRPDLKIIPIRGNVDTRIRKLDSGKYDGIILAVEGLNRLGIQRRIKQIISEKIILPPCGQGAIGIQSRINDTYILFLISGLNHKLSNIQITAEREFCKKLGANCNIPIGIYTYFKNKNLKLRGLVGSIDGKKVIKGKRKGSLITAKYLGRSLAKELIKKGAKKILKAVK